MHNGIPHLSTIALRNQLPLLALPSSSQHLLLAIASTKYHVLFGHENAGSACRQLAEYHAKLSHTLFIQVHGMAHRAEVPETGLSLSLPMINIAAYHH